VPVDTAAKAIARMTEWALANPPQTFKSFNLTPKVGLSVKDFYAAVSKHIGLPPKQNILTEGIPDALVKTAAKWLAGFPQADLHYLLNFPKYDSQDTTEILGDWCPEFPNYERAFWRGYEEFLQNR
jgi:hypothetical protein